MLRPANGGTWSPTGNLDNQSLPLADSILSANTLACSLDARTRSWHLGCIREQTDEDHGPRGSQVLAGGGRNQTINNTKANRHLNQVIAQCIKAVGMPWGKLQSGARISRNSDALGWNFKKGNQKRRQ